MTWFHSRDQIRVAAVVFGPRRQYGQAGLKRKWRAEARQWVS
jgi:hypothetical protein